MLQRVSPLEPGIQHSVGKNEVWCDGFVQGAPDPEAVVLPDAMDNDGVIFPAMLFEPRREARRVTVSAAAATKRMHAHRKFANPWISRRIERNHFNAMSATRQDRGGLSDRLHRPTDRRVKRMNGPKYFHSGCVKAAIVL